MHYITEERFVLELPTSRAMLATARPSYYKPNRSTSTNDVVQIQTDRQTGRRHVRSKTLN